MSLEQKKQFIVDQLQTITDDISFMENNPSKIEANISINRLYQVMRQISDWAEENGYNPGELKSK